MDLKAEFGDDGVKLGASATIREFGDLVGMMLGVPSVEPPSVEPPSIEPPSIEPPSIELPSVEMPSVEVPSIEVPTPTPDSESLDPEVLAAAVAEIYQDLAPARDTW